MASCSFKHKSFLLHILNLRSKFTVLLKGDFFFSPCYPVCSFAGDAVTEYSRLKQQTLFSHDLEARSPRSGCHRTGFSGGLPPGPGGATFSLCPRVVLTLLLVRTLVLWDQSPP